MEIFILLFFICAGIYHLFFAHDKKARFNVKIQGHMPFKNVSYESMQRLVNSCKEDKIAYTVTQLKKKA